MYVEVDIVMKIILLFVKKNNLWNIFEMFLNWY